MFFGDAIGLKSRICPSFHYKSSYSDKISVKRFVLNRQTFWRTALMYLIRNSYENQLAIWFYGYFRLHFKITKILILCQLCQYSGFDGYHHFCPYYQAIIWLMFEGHRSIKMVRRALWMTLPPKFWNYPIWGKFEILLIFHVVCTRIMFLLNCLTCRNV